MRWFGEYKNRVMAVYIVGMFIQIIDGTIVNIAIPTLADEFDVEATDVDWAVIGYYLAVIVVIPIAGFVGDRFGTRRIFLLALGGFVAASALCGAAQSLEQLIAFRMFQGLFAGMITPIGSAMLYRAFPLEERARASAAVITVAVIAPAIGPALGGIIVETLSWRWIFYINIPIGGLGVLAGWRWLREEVVGTSGRVDWAGVILSAGGLGLLLYGISEGPNRGWGSGLIVASLLIGALAVVALIVVETRIADPILALRLFRNRLFRATNLASAPIYMAFFSYIFLLPIFLQKVGDHSALTTGLTVSLQAIGVIISSQVAGNMLYPLLGPRLLLVVGSAAAFATSVWFVTIDESTALASVALMTFLRGLGMGLIFISIQTATYATIELPDMSRATALFNIGRQASVATGIAIMATVVSSMVASLDPPAEGGSPTPERVEAFQTAFGVSAALFIVGGVLAIFVSTEDARPTMQRRNARAR
jgi:EmrB/QacA subfamily drug resistance transporter